MVLGIFFCCGKKKDISIRSDIHHREDINYTNHIYLCPYYKPVCYEIHQVMAPTARADAHDVIRSVGLRGGGLLVTEPRGHERSARSR